MARGNLREYLAIQTRRYTYVRDLVGPWLLYDDEKDPNQTRNLVDADGFAQVTQETDNLLQSQLKRIGDDFRPGADYLAEWGYQIGAHGSVPYGPSATNVQAPHRRASEPHRRASEPQGAVPDKKNSP